MDKFKHFLQNAKIINVHFGVIPLLYGSLGLEILTGMPLMAEDIDILVPKLFMSEKWEQFKSVLENNGYVLVDLHEHTFTKYGVEYSFADIEDLKLFANIDIEEIPILNKNDVEFKLLTLEQYLSVYKKSLHDGYRINIRQKKDCEKIKLIEELIKLR